MESYLVIDEPGEFNLKIQGVQEVSSLDYLTNSRFSRSRHARVYNFCRTFRYQSSGYYVSLLAEARGHRVVPTVRTIQDIRSQPLLRSLSDDLEILIQKKLKPIQSDTFDLSVYFGSNMAARYQDLARALFNLVPVPLLRARFVRESWWRIKSLSPIPWSEVPESHRPDVRQFAEAYFSKPRFAPKTKAWKAYDLAILVNPNEEHPPSNAKALKFFQSAAREVGFAPECITREDFSSLREFDALLIRETTAVNHHTYRFSRRAAMEGLAVIDDPNSILRCANKVYIKELLAANRIRQPKSEIVHRGNAAHLADVWDYPCVLKQPDGSFSQGVTKATSPWKFRETLEEMFRRSDFAIVQEFLPTPYDWRVGVLDGKALYACKYFMASGHWQIYNWKHKRSSLQSGESETMRPEDAPESILKTALRAAALVGDGFYGVDLKEAGGKAYVIEINDNPSVDAGIEDEVLGQDLYRVILQSLRSRLERLRGMGQDAVR